MPTIVEKLKESSITILVTSFITLITIFSDKIFENIKFGLNRADLRISQYENLATGISDFAFEAENITEYYEYGWTTKLSLEVVAPEYNAAITNLRRKEYVVTGWLNRFWSKEDVMRYTVIMETAKKIDFQIHSLNMEAELIVNGKKEKADTAITGPVVKNLKLLNAELQQQITHFLSKLI